MYTLVDLVLHSWVRLTIYICGLSLTQPPVVSILLLGELSTLDLSTFYWKLPRRPWCACVAASQSITTYIIVKASKHPVDISWVRNSLETRHGTTPISTNSAGIFEVFLCHLC